MWDSNPRSPCEDTRFPVVPNRPLWQLSAIRKNRIAMRFFVYGGESGIRTHDEVAPIPVFETGALNRSAISPHFRSRIIPCKWSSTAIDQSTTRPLYCPIQGTIKKEAMNITIVLCLTKLVLVGGGKSKCLSHRAKQSKPSSGRLKWNDPSVQFILMMPGIFSCSYSSHQ